MGKDDGIFGTINKSNQCYNNIILLLNKKINRKHELFLKKTLKFVENCQETFEFRACLGRFYMKNSCVHCITEKIRGKSTGQFAFDMALNHGMWQKYAELRAVRHLGIQFYRERFIKIQKIPIFID